MDSALVIYIGTSGYRYETIAEDIISITRKTWRNVITIKPELLQNL